MKSRSHASVARWIRRELHTAPPRAKSLVVTVWGDALAPHGGAVWLSGLIRLLEPLGLNERLVRTSVYRLARDGWLASRQAGRRSLYRLTAQGRRRFERAYRRIYAAPSDDWDGHWDLIVSRSPGDGTRRDKFRRELGLGGIWCDCRRRLCPTGPPRSDGPGRNSRRAGPIRWKSCCFAGGKRRPPGSRSNRCYGSTGTWRASMPATAVSSAAFAGSSSSSATIRSPILANVLSCVPC